MIWCVTLNPALDVTYRLPRDLAWGAINLADAMDAQLGGKGNNVARTVRALGAPVTVVEILGGTIGFELARRAESLGMAVLAEEVAEDSRVCLTLASMDGSVTELRPPGPTVDISSADALLVKLQERVGPQDWVTISGSLPRGLPADTYARWVECLRPCVAGVIVDASGPPLEQAVFAGPSAIVPNRAEYEAAAPHLRPGETEVVVTDGDKGVAWQAARGDWRRWQAPAVSVVNPVGAGDSFLGALVVALAGGASYEEAIPRAMAVASASVETLGVALFNPERAAELLGQIREVLQ